MKKMIIIGGAAVVVLGLAAVVVAGKAGHHEEHVDWKSKRGTDAYYTSGIQQYELKDLTVNLKGTEGQRYLVIGIGIGYQVGAEEPDPKAPFTKAEMALKDELTMLLSNKTQREIEGKENLLLLKHEILDHVQSTVFPEKTGRVEQIFIRQMLVQ